MPSVLRQFVSQEQISRFDSARIEQWISASRGYRVFVDGDSTKQKISARHIPAEDARYIRDALGQSGLRFTILLNGVECFDPAVVNLRDSFRVPHRWREDDVIATISARGSGIGYHAGHEDGLIIQVEGKRSWKVWDHSEVNSDVRRAITLNELPDSYQFEAPRTSPILECELSSGDALDIPPFFPHQGVTLERSVSIAFGWRGITVKNIADALVGVVLPPLRGPDDEELCCLVEDFDSETTSAGEHARNLAEQLTASGYVIPSKHDFVRQVMAIYGSPTAVPKHYA